eukprot:gene7052-14351_t
MATGTATVKAVLSGDTILLVGKAVNGPPQEITITLANLQAPRPARGPQQTDEPFAWASREHLRQLCIGKSVQFKVVQSVPTINRNFGDVELDGTNVSLAVVRNGWATVKEAREPYNSGVYTQLVELENEAKAAKVGIYTDDNAVRAKAVRTLQWSPTSATVEQLYNSKKGGVIRVVIEFIRDGASLRCLHLDSMTYLTVSLTGVLCPRLNTPKSDADPATPPVPPEPFALQAKHFTELRMLNREVDLVVDGIDRSGTLLVTVKHPKGNIAVEILKNGLGKISDLTLVLLPRELATTLRHAETEAKEDRRCIWTTYEPPSHNTGIVRSFTARVVEVLSADSLSVMECPPSHEGLEGEAEAAAVAELCSSGEEIRVGLSSIRGGVMVSPDEPWARDAKEFVRSRVIGMVVRVDIEYNRTFGRTEEGSETITRAFGTVRYSPNTTGKPTPAGKGKTASRPADVNIAEQLLREGLGKAVRHRQGEDKSSDYDSLLRAEQDAVAAKKGVHSEGGGGNSVSPRINDVSSDSKKAKLLFPALQRVRTHKAIVEHVFTGSRFKVIIPSENCAIQLSLSQVRAPLPGRAGPAVVPAAPASVTTETDATEEPVVVVAAGGRTPLTGREAEPCADLSRRYARLMLLQRQVEVEVDDMDKNGICLGKVTTLLSTPLIAVRKSSSSPRSFALGLLRHVEAAELSEEQSAAKSQLKGLWEYWKEEEVSAVTVSGTTDGDGDGDSPVDGVDTKDKVVGSGAMALRGVRISEIVDGTNFFVQFVDESAAVGLLAVENAMAVFSSTSPPPALLATSLKKGLQCAALFDDKSGAGAKWFRVRVESVTKASGGNSSGEETKAAVLYLDYGNRETVPLSRLGELSPAAFTATPPQAIKCALAYLRAAGPVDTEIGRSAAIALSDMVWGKELFAQSLWKDQDRDKSEGAGAGAAGTTHLMALYDVADAESINERMALEGWCRVSETAVRRASRATFQRASETASGTLLAKLREAEEEAHRSHVNMWAYGDPGGSDDEDNGPPSRR